MTRQKEIRIQGVALCSGIAIGVPFYLSKMRQIIPDYEVKEENIENEIQRYQSALRYSREDLKSLLKNLEGEGAVDAATILDTHLQLMDDPIITSQIESEIRDKKRNAESIFQKLLDKLQKKFSRIPDPFFRERVGDILDVSKRVMAHLKNQSMSTGLSQVPADSIVFSQELSPSDTAEATQASVKAIVTHNSGATSHAAIVAKAKGIPLVTNINILQIHRANSKIVIVDGQLGEVILHPTEATLQYYTKVHQKLLNDFSHLEKTSYLAAETFDGYHIRLSGNMEMVQELEVLHQYGGSGVGLFRSEFMFLTKNAFPSEEEQFAIYKGLVDKMRGLPVVIRTFDVGGDKFIPHFQKSKEANPLQGCRAVRLMLEEKEVFKTQIRAILRASAFGDVSVLFPMVSGLQELLEAKKIVKEVEHELKEKRIFLGNTPRIGCMIELPSAAIISDILAKECDFLSIGTNDLVQYALAVDRGQAQHPMFSATHPSVIRMIKMVVTEGVRHGISVSVCGEMASDPLYTPLLIGLGVRELSVGLRHILIIKSTIRRTSIVEAAQLAREILNMSSPTEIRNRLLEYQKQASDELEHVFS